MSTVETATEIRPFHVETSAEQIEDLRRNGVERFHLYALNRSETALALFGSGERETSMTAAA